MKNLKITLLTVHGIQTERRIAHTKTSNSEKWDIPKSEIESLARFLLPEIQRFFESEEGRKEFEEWKRKQESK